MAIWFCVKVIFPIQQLNSKDMDTPLSPTLLQEVEAAFEQISALPLTIFVSRPDGSVIFANQRALEFFNIKGDLREFDISNCYEDPSEREYILENLHKAEKGTWVEKLHAKLNINGQHHWVRFSSKPFFDEQDALQAMLNLTDSLSESEWFGDFIADMKAGFFEVDRHLKVTSCNHAVGDILGFDNHLDILGRSVIDFLWDEGASPALLKDILEKRHLRDVQIKLRRLDDAMVIAKLTCSTTSWEHGRISRVKGVIRDITFETLQDDLPVGLFLITKTSKGELYSRVNATFAKIHGFESVSDIIGKPANIENINESTYDAYRAELDKAASNNQPLMDYYMEIQQKNGDKKNVVVNVHHVEGGNGNIRVGAVYDLTDHVGKQRHELETNFGAILHTYIATVDGLRKTLYALIKAHGSNFMREGERQINRDLAQIEMKSHQKQLEAHVKRLALLIEERGIKKEPLMALRKHFKDLSDGPPEEEDRQVDDQDVAIWGRRKLVEMRRQIETLKQFSLPKELLRNMSNEVNNLMMISTLSALSISVSELNSRIYDFKYLRNFLLRGDKGKEEFKTQNIIPILSEASRYLEEFAASGKVLIHRHFNLREEYFVHCHANSLNRAFYNLIHNAIKYSWTKGLQSQPWVNIKVEKRQNKVEVTFENWGVPIRKEEIESGVIFQFGKRGRESDDKGRAGTGIGLHDTLNIVKNHGGLITLTSEPTAGNPPTAYNHPFITKITITLPLAQQ